LLFPHAKPQNVALLSDKALRLTYNGRGAIFQACAEIARYGRRKILMPAFHCPSGITPAINAGLTPVFYRIRRDLSIDFDDLRAKADHETAAILVIHFFGRVTDLTQLDPIREAGVALIEDCSHSFLQADPLRLSGGDADYRIYSFWKLLPSGVGGGLLRRGNRNGTEASPSGQRQPPWRERLVRSKRMFEEALAHSDLKRTQRVFEMLEAARLAARRPLQAPVPDTGAEALPGEAHHPFDQAMADCGIPGTARRILFGSDLPDIVQRRRVNYRRYGEGLASDSRLQVLFPSLAPHTCPWVFPVLLEQRDQIDHRWRAAGVALHTFGIHLHSALYRDADPRTVADAVYLSNNLLCLSVHQGLTEQHIVYSTTMIMKFLAGEECWENGAF